MSGQTHTHSDPLVLGRGAGGRKGGLFRTGIALQFQSVQHL